MNYIIITPAKNEEKFIEKTIQSVINQTIKPKLWVIVDDGSTDATAEIVKKYLIDYPFIKLIHRETSNERHFGNKVYAIRRGFEEIKDIEYQFYCNLDADVSFESDYFEFLLKKFAENPKLGICGGKVYDLINGRFVPQKYENHSVAGPVQFFRKECYESFGGYQIFKSGFIDGHAEISARKNGWVTQTFPELMVRHYKPAGVAKGSLWKIRYEGGKFEYKFGYSYLYHLLRTISTINSFRSFFGAISCMFGYLICVIKGDEKLVDDDFIKFVRFEQKQRLKNFLFDFTKR
ncbi:MAG: glycosyltransferase family 2 protein [Ignavibacterium album]|uniref:glycosyltransferase n=1 Tax=Ignavibacterium album TaxID=591197 RepID=UPI0026F16CB5|nr:glycosyltransferase family 2 protein [Ignavibacterium album]MBI5661138.1 glycosyltransferase family 2 protein [Ignavibacterium album]